MKAIRCAAAAVASAAGASLLLLLLSLGASPPAWSQATTGRSIYSCVSASGKTLSSDRLIAECTGREQRILNPDGTLNRVLPPSLTADERARAEERDSAAAVARAARADAARRDRSLLTRYPDETAHRRARDATLDSARKLLQANEARLTSLAKERMPLVADAEFYVGKPLPPQLRAQLDANDVSTEGQRSQIESQKLEMARVNRLYDAELERLKKLWAGAPPGSLEGRAAASSAPVK